MADDPWIVQARTSRTCTTCTSEFTAEQVAAPRSVGWTPLRSAGDVVYDGYVADSKCCAFSS